jgi:subtilisin family serine protease
VWEALLRAPVVQTRTLPPDPNGRIITQRVIEWKGRYPLLRIEEDRTRGAAEPVERRVMVADHLMVKRRDGISHDQLASWVQSMGLDIRRRMPGSDFYLIALPSGSLEGFDALQQKLNGPEMPVEYAEPDPIRFSAGVPNDALFPNQWALRNLGQTGGGQSVDVDASGAWDTTRGDASLVVAVLDSGMDLTHPDLAANRWVNPGEVPNNNLDDDGDGLVDNVNGWNFLSDSNYLTDYAGHGTHCAGIVGAAGNNSIGVSGIAPVVKIMPLVVIDSDGLLFTSDAVNAMNHAVAKHVLVTSNSYGGTTSSKAEKAAIDAAQAQGILVVCAAGNDYPAKNIDTARLYPAAYSSANIISVAATTDMDARAAFSNYGVASVDLGAPGVGILSTLPGGTYGYESGTSMACPLVAGACVLVKAAHPTLAWSGIRSAILNSVDPVPGLKGKVATGGRLNVGRAVRIGSQPWIEVTKTEVKDATLLGALGNGNGIANPGEDVTVAITVKNVGPLTAANVTTVLSTSAADVSVLRGSRTWGSVTAGASLTNNHSNALPFLLRIDPTASVQQVPLIFTHTDSAGHSWTSQSLLTVAGTHALSGRVTYLTGGKPVKGAVVSYTGPVSGSLTTNADGIYSAQLPDGAYKMTAKLKGYEVPVAQSITLPPAATEVNFALGRAVLVAAPTALAITHPENAMTTKALTLSNRGDLPLNVTVQNSSLGNTISSGFYNAPSYGVARNSQAAYTPLPWQDGFESGVSSLVPSRYHLEYEEADWPYIYHYTIDYYLGSSAVVSNTAAVGLRSLHYRDPWFAGFENGLQRRFAEGTRPRYISYWVRPGSSTGNSGCFGLEQGYYDSYSKSWSWDSIISIRANAGGKLMVNDVLSGGDNSVPFTPKAWHHIELRNINWTTRTFDYWVGGVLIKAGIRLWGEATSATRVHVYNDTIEGESWWDELRVLDQNDAWMSEHPSTLALAPGASGMVYVTATAMNERPGVYKSQLNLLSNDPVRPAVNVPVTMTVTPHPNTAPVATNQMVMIDEDTPTTIPLHVTDKEDDPLTITIKTLPRVGILRVAPLGQALTSAPVTITGSSPAVYYEPPLNGIGNKLASFTFQARDYRLSSAVATVTINVRNVNDPPVAVDDLAVMNNGTTGVSLNVLANDTDRDEEPLTIISYTQGSKGTVVAGITQGQFVYTPRSDFSFGEDAFTYTMTDGRADPATATVRVMRATSVTASGAEDTDVPVTLTGPEASSDGVVTHIVALPANGSLFQTGDGVTAGLPITAIGTVVTHPGGKVIFRPARDASGSGGTPYAIFRFDVARATGGAGAQASASIYITPVPDPPRLTDDLFTVTAGTTTTILPLLNDIDPDGGSISITSFTQPSNCNLSLNAQGSLDLSIDAMSGGSVSTFTYTVTDSTGLSSTATVRLRIKGTSPNAWPTIGGDPDHRGYTPATLGVGTLSEQWSTSVGTAASQVAVAGGQGLRHEPRLFRRHSGDRPGRSDGQRDLAAELHICLEHQPAHVVWRQGLCAGAGRPQPDITPSVLQRCGRGHSVVQPVLSAVGALSGPCCGRDRSLHQWRRLRRHLWLRHRHGHPALLHQSPAI